MIEIRIHGRGGQGSVTAAEVIALAADKCHNYAQAFPKFGVERRGAPIMAFIRLDKKFIRTREEIRFPNVLIIQDASLIELPEVMKGTDENTIVILNSNQEKESFKKYVKNLDNLYIIPATDISLDVIGRAIVNTVLIGAFAKICKLVTLTGAKSAVKEYLEKLGPKLVQKNVKAVEAGFKYFK